MMVRNLTVLVFAGCLLSFGSPRPAASGSVAPLPIPGGDVIPCPCTGQAGGSLLIHQFLPGPGFDGQDAEPNGITNFNGTFAQVYMGGHAVDSAGRTWDVDVDTRVYRKYSLFPDRREYETSLGGSSPRFRTSSRKGTDWRFFNEFKKELKG